MPVMLSTTKSLGSTFEHSERDQLAALRATTLPIVYTVRTVSQGGAFPDSAHEEAYELLSLAFKLGVEYLDVETTLPEKYIQRLCAAKGSSQIIASWHDWSGKFRWNSATAQEKYDIAAKLGDIVKIVGKANDIHDNFELYDFVSKNNKKPGSKPIIAINMGLQGQMSRVLNSTFSPVTHPALPVKAAPGQLSFRQIQEALHLLGIFPARKFYLFGNPIQYSMSPTLHNTGFDILGFPHHYGLLETPSVNDEVKQAIASPDFGGASVTIPFKLDVIPLLDELSPAAKAIGAVNTIVPRYDENGNRTLYGDNSDWLGMRECINASLPCGSIATALVVGAGGTARAAIYALQFLGAGKIFLYNRTSSKAQELADAFGSGPSTIQVLESLAQWPSGVMPPRVVISTVPSSAMAPSGDAGHSRLVVSESVFGFRDAKAVIIDMAYKPAETPLLKLAKEVNEREGSAKNWVLVPGLEVLLEQGYVQFELWTHRKAPRKVIAETVRARYHREA